MTSKRKLEKNVSIISSFSYKAVSGHFTSCKSRKSLEFTSLLKSCLQLSILLTYEL